MNAFLDTVITVVAQKATLPEDYKLDIYPNPFNPSTTLRYVLSKRSQVKLTIFNLMGQKIATLMNTSKEPGAYSVVWNGSDNSGRSMASGVYFVNLEAAGTILSRKVILMK